MLSYRSSNEEGEENGLRFPLMRSQPSSFMGEEVMSRKNDCERAFPGLG